MISGIVIYRSSGSHNVVFRIRRGEAGFAFTFSELCPFAPPNIKIQKTGANAAGNAGVAPPLLVAPLQVV
jgi:hypothetical protein